MLFFPSSLEHRNAMRILAVWATSQTHWETRGGGGGVRRGRRRRRRRQGRSRTAHASGHIDTNGWTYCHTLPQPYKAAGLYRWLTWWDFSVYSQNKSTSVLHTQYKCHCIGDCDQLTIIVCRLTSYAFGVYGQARIMQKHSQPRMLLINALYPFGLHQIPNPTLLQCMVVCLG